MIATPSRRVAIAALLYAILGMPLDGADAIPDEAPAAPPPFASGPDSFRAPSGPAERNIHAAPLPDGKPLSTRLPRPAGWLLLGLSIAPLFWGWKLIRWTVIFFFGAIAGAVGLEWAAGRFGALGALAAAAAGTAAGAVLGAHVRKFFTALEGALVIGCLFSLPGLLTGSDLLLLGLPPVGIALGLVLGWKAAFYMDAIDSSLIGGAMAGLGAMTVARDAGDDAALLLGAAALAASALAGIAVQFRSVRRACRARDA
jgi:hypothetical protein